MSYKLNKTQYKSFSKKLTKNLDNKIVKEWLENPLQDPFSKETIQVDIADKSKYYLLYTRVFEYLSEQGQYEDEILEIMPKNHLLFNESFNPILDFQNIYKYYTEKYSFVLTNSEIYNEETFILRVVERMYIGLVQIYKEFFANVLLGDGIFMSSKKLNEYSERFNSFGDDIESFYYDILHTDELRQNVDKIFIKIHQDKILMSENDMFFNDIEFSQQVNSGTYPFFIFYQSLVDDISNLIKNIIETGKDIIRNKQLVNLSLRMDDPLIKILEHPKFKDINLENLEPPKQTFTDKQYTKLKQKQQTLKDAYNTSLKSFKDDATSRTSPKIPTMKINGNTVDARIAMIRQNYTDKQYSSLLKEYQKHKPIIDEYKNLIDIGFLKLTNTYHTDVPPRLKQTRQEIKNNDLNDVSPTSCNGNIDVISQSNLDDDNYPLSKLQLISKVHTRNKKREIIRTDCFYAPDLYNFITMNIHSNKPVNNPSTGMKIDDEDIDNLMKIINFIEPSRLYPGNHSKIIDKALNLKIEELKIQELELESESDTSNINRFYALSISRKMLNTPYDFTVDIIPDIFFIPSWITVEDSQSTDLTSEIVLLNLHTLFQNGELLALHMPPYRNINSRNPTYLNHKLKSVNYFLNDWVSTNESSRNDMKAKQLEMLRKVNDVILSLM